VSAKPGASIFMACEADAKARDETRNLVMATMMSYPFKATPPVSMDETVFWAWRL
jgi:hypothetical protein